MMADRIQQQPAGVPVISVSLPIPAGVAAVLTQMDALGVGPTMIAVEGWSSGEPVVVIWRGMRPYQPWVESGLTGSEGWPTMRELAIREERRKAGVTNSSLDSTYDLSGYLLEDNGEELAF